MFFTNITLFTNTTLSTHHALYRHHALCTSFKDITVPTDATVPTAYPLLVHLLTARRHSFTSTRRPTTFLFARFGVSELGYGYEKG